MKKLGKTIGDARQRLARAHGELMRAHHAYEKWLRKESLRVSIKYNEEVKPRFDVLKALDKAGKKGKKR